MKLPERPPFAEKEEPPAPGEAYVIRLTTKDGTQKLASHRSGTVFRFKEIDNAIRAMKASHGVLFRLGRAAVIPERAWESR